MKKFLVKHYSVIESENDYLILTEENHIVEFEGEVDRNVEKFLKRKVKEECYYFIKSDLLTFKDIDRKSVPLIIKRDNKKKKVIELSLVD